MTQMEDRGSKKRILAVDDAAITLSRIVEILQDDYEVVTANSGARALRYLENAKPDLVLLDIRMAPVDGFEMLRSMRAMKGRSDIPVIMLTGMEDRKSVLESAKLGICDYVLKPFVAEDLLKRVRQALGTENQDEKHDFQKELLEMMNRT